MLNGSLEDRVAALERIAGSMAQPGYSSLNGAVVAADGSITYDFDGHISSSGIDLNSEGSPDFPGGSQLIWKRSTDGSRAMVVSGFTNPGGPGANTFGFVDVHGQSPSAPAQLQLTAEQGNYANYSRLSLYGNSGGGAIQAEVNGKLRTLLGLGGKSNFPSWSRGISYSGDSAGSTRTIALEFATQRFAGSLNAGATGFFTDVPVGLGVVIFTGSAYQTVNGAMGFIDCTFNGVNTGGMSQFFNEASSHRAFGPLLYGPVSLTRPDGLYSFFMATNPANGTQSDGNDVFSCSLVVL
jgi:hypothetical protein